MVGLSPRSPASQCQNRLPEVIHHRTGQSQGSLITSLSPPKPGRTQHHSAHQFSYTSMPWWRDGRTVRACFLSVVLVHLLDQRTKDISMKLRSWRPWILQKLCKASVLVHAMLWFDLFDFFDPKDQEIRSPYVMFGTCARSYKRVTLSWLSLFWDCRTMIRTFHIRACCCTMLQIMIYIMYLYKHLFCWKADRCHSLWDGLVIKRVW